ncbi:MAG TPA: ABC-F family ATP-binding cassette domain-containing protein [Polyangiaceae bacterium]|nr:ABC-F family ATP-binding cassette domain-containing protein [Polyangiaceae bacterium]
MPVLTAQHLRKSFGPQVVLDDATFTLARREKVGLIGANGAGKSTLARILAGQETPDGGSVSVRRGLTVRYLAQEPELDPRSSARAVVEDALVAWRAATTRHAEVSAELGAASAPGRRDALVAEQAELDDAVARLGGWERGHEALGFLQRLGVEEVDRPCGERSGGERRRIALAQLLVASPDVAVLDEPTNHLDVDAAEWLEEYLADAFPGAILLVTHDRYFLDAVVTRVVELERGTLTGYAGGYGDYLEKKAELLAHEGRVEQNRQNALRREREWLARGPKARGTKQKARIQRARALEAQEAATAGRPGQVTLVTSASPRPGKTILELRAAQVAPAPGMAALHEPFDLVLRSGERVGVVGPNGAGKTTLVRAVLAAAEEARTGVRPAGSPQVVSGEVIVGKNARVAYLDQARQGLDDTKSIFDDVRGDGSTTVHLGVRGLETLDLRSYLELLLFDPHKQRQKVGSLSGGERARVALAKVLRQGANLLVFDEPTNDLDLPTLAALEEMLCGFDGSVLVVTHDRAFLDRVATSIVAFERRGGHADAGCASRVTRYAGGYHDYLAQRERTPAPRAPEELPPAPPVAPPAHSAKGRAKGGLTYAERLELDAIVDEVEAAERAVAEVEALLGDPSLYAKRGGEVAGLQTRLEAAKAEAARRVARWEELEAKKAATSAT